MSTKTLNTRIQSKIDTIENWNKSTLPLLAGEIAIATVPATEENGLTDPVCIIRIGEDGVKPFSQLKDALHAKAIDVLPICKDSEALKAFIQDSIDMDSILEEFEQYLTDLTKEDQAQDGYYVSAVSQENGLITVSRQQLPNFLQDIKIDIGEHEGKKNCILLKDADSKIISYVEADVFVKDGMLDTVEYNETTNKLILTWNTESGKGEPIEINLTNLISRYYSGEGITISDDGIISLNETALAYLLKGESAIQTITTNDIVKSETETSPSGLIATKGENNDYNIAIDDSITFIFNCGDAGVTE